MTTGIGGQPGTLMIGLSVIRSDTDTAPVGLGLACGMPPNAAQLPTAMMAAASAAVSVSMSRLETPAMVEKPGLPSGMEPSTTSRYLPLFSAIAVVRAASAASPEAACRVW